MNCPKCQTSNPADARFCMKCGAPLAVACPQCGTALPAAAQFCFQCGRPLAAPQAAPAQDRLQQYIPRELLAKMESARASGGMRGERRVVTMLFCDVRGSTAAAEKLDPEEWAEIMNGAFERLIAPVYRYEGTLARILGDAILAFFGAPIAHEDDPQRAVLAGLDMIQAIGLYREGVKRKWGLDFDVRVGINTGLVVVGEVGSDLHLEYTALGDAVNQAARMEQTAQPGTVQITENTHKLVAPLFEFEDLGRVSVKGKQEPVRAYRALGPKVEPGRVRGLEGLDSPLVGRDREMDALRGALADLRRGRGQIVAVMGEAGLGKSRLVAELRRSLASQGLSPAAGSESGAGIIDGGTPALRWCEGRSLSYQASTPYAPFVHLFSAYFHVRAEETDDEKYQKVRAQVAELLPERVEETAPFLATLLGIKLAGEEAERVRYLQPPQVREQVFRATRDFVERLAAAQPLVLVFEDLHWVDPTSLDLLEQLMPLTDRVALMIIGVFRPSQQEPSWRFHEVAMRDYTHRYLSVVLEPLDENSSRALVANLLHIEGLPEKVRSLILTKAEGNPFFVEEVIRSLLDAKLVVRDNAHWRATREIDRIAVPNTLAGVITARLDRLGDESKRVVQTASVIGREFSFDMLAQIHEAPHLLDEALADLQRRELVRERSRVPRRVFMFKHVLTQDTAYASLLLSRCRELHRRVAECLERMAPDSVNEVARHFLEAREHARALPYVIEAGDRAARAYSTPEAIGFYTRALEILETEKSMPLARRAYEGLGGALTFAGDVPRAVENYRKMLHVAEGEGDDPVQVSALNKLGFVAAMMQGQVPEAEKHLVSAERLARGCQDLPGLAETHMTYCYVRTGTGDFDDAVDHLTQSAQIGRDLNLEEPKLFGLTHTANTLNYMTRFDEAWQTAQEARRLAEEAGNRKYLSELLALTLPIIHVRNGDLDTARRSAEEGVAMAALIGAAPNEGAGAFCLGQIAWMRGQYEQAIAFHQRALEAGGRSGIPYLQVVALCALGTVHVDISRELADRAEAFQTQALQMMEHPFARIMGATAWSDLGFCALALGAVEQADEYFQKGLTVSTATKNLARPQLLLGSALAAVARDRMDAAADFVKEAQTFAEERAMKHVYPMIAFAGARLSAARGQTERALEQFSRGEELALAMQMWSLVWQLRAGAAQLLSAAGRDSDAAEKRRQARAMIDEIGWMFQDEKLRGLFVENAIRSLE